MPVLDQVQDDGSGIQKPLNLLDSAIASLRARLSPECQQNVKIDFLRVYQFCMPKKLKNEEAKKISRFWLALSNFI